MPTFENRQDSPDPLADSVPQSVRETAHAILVNPETATRAAREIEAKLPPLRPVEAAPEKSDALGSELSGANVRAINEYVRNTVANNGISGKTELQLVLIDAVAKTPAMIEKFPTLCNELNRIGCLKDRPGATSADVFSAIQQIKPTLEKAGYYLNTDVLQSGDFLIPVEGTASPDRQALSGLYGPDLPELRDVTVISDPTLEKQGYQIAGFGLLNGANIEANLRSYVENGRFTPEQLGRFDVESIKQATVNHEESHRVLKEQYAFPGRKELSPEDGKAWMADGIDFVPANTAQIDEFLAHSIGQQTDKYEIMTNIGNAIAEFKVDPDTGKASYQVENPKGDYALLQTFVMEEVARIFEEKGVRDFKSAISERKTEYVSEGHTFGKIRERASAHVDFLRESWADQASIDAFSNSAQATLDTMDPQAINARADRAWNETVGDVLKTLTDDDYRRIGEKCMAQAKKYLARIESEYGKRPQPTATA